MSKTRCENCGYEFTNRAGNYKKHFSACDGTPPFQKRKSCKHCDLDFAGLTTSERANHSRWCDKNPKRTQYAIDTAKMRAGITAESVTTRANSIKKAHADGKYVGAPAKSFQTKLERGNLCHSDESKPVSYTHLTLPTNREV